MCEYMARRTSWPTDECCTGERFSPQSAALPQGSTRTDVRPNVVRVTGVPRGTAVTVVLGVAGSDVGDIVAVTVGGGVAVGGAVGGTAVPPAATALTKIDAF